MSYEWSIKSIGNGYVVSYPYVSSVTPIGVVGRATLFMPSFDEALEVLKENSMRPNPEKDNPPRG